MPARRATARWILCAGLLATAVLGIGVGRAQDEDPLHDFAATPEDAFRPATLCARCHAEGSRATAMRDAEGHDISPFGLWQSSMMANAARDPVWRAAVAVEVAGTPSRKSDIEAACMRCHAPMATPGAGLAGLVLAGPGDELGIDGASCTVCHRILPAGLGREASFSGGWRIDDADRAFGPHAEPFANPMRMQTGLVPTASPHVLESALCATCHTLRTPALAADGRPTGGSLPEQTPYLEWRNSAYTTEARGKPLPEARSCQDCHLPTTDDGGRVLETRIARNPGGRDFPSTAPRTPYGRHLLVGGNALVPRLLRAHGDLLDAAAPPAAFEATLASVGRQLASAADLDLVGLAWRPGELELDVRIENRAGHRLPTAHPTRRLWLALTVEDAEGRTLFASGAWDAGGRIVDAAGRRLPEEQSGGPTYPHRDVVRQAAEVALYEAQMEDADGRPTWLLLRGERYVKDDRLLPRGWRPDGPHAEATRPHGLGSDADFGAGSDVVHYRIGLPQDVPAPVTVHLRLVHQSLGARWLAEWQTYDLPAVRLLTSLLGAEPIVPSVLCTLDLEIQPPGTGR